MIKVEVVERFTLANFKKLKSVEKVMARKENEFGVGDTFECDKEMVDYLTGNNAFKKEVVKVIEVKPEKESSKEGWAVTKEEDNNIHVRPTIDGEIIDTPIEKVIKPKKTPKKKTTKKTSKK